MNIGEASDFNRLLSYLLGKYAYQVRFPDREEHDPPPPPSEAREAAERLADRAYRALHAGWDGETLRQALMLPRSDGEAQMLAGFRGEADGG